ncbi:MAG: hypothetical protein DHS20C19_08230 [Acidimicrobiales bacterium]|nr:MAG: hypothetical protein DHS20C19_08230 [Acidimicrobiales bacterium]
MATTTRPAPAPALEETHWYERPYLAALVLAALLISLLLLTHPMGFLSTDVGGKLATLEAMERNGGVSPDLGYWAADVDPDGSLYPMFRTSRVGDTWVNVTTVPMLLLALPLYLLGGAVAAGLIPVAGTVAAALGARALARRLGADGTAAFWIVGAASPLTIYALDFWEHSLGVALMVWAVALALDASQPDGRARGAVVVGVLFGLAAAMRQEALVYGFVTGAALGTRLLVGGRLLGALARGGALLLGFAAAFAANSVLEDLVIGDSRRAGRSAGTASRVGGDLALRAEEAVMTLASPFARSQAVYLVLALVLLGGLVELGRRADLDGDSVRPIALVVGAIGALLVADIAASGMSFVPGLAATTPVAALALGRRWGTGDQRLVAAIAVGSLPLVWAVQYTGGAGPQWGGRYILLTGTLLTVLATVVLRSERERIVLRRVAFAGAAVTLIGVAWTVQRTHGFADAVQALADRDEPVLVFHDPHLAREGGVLVLDEQWFAATGEEERAEAADALATIGVDEIGFVQHDRGDEPIVLPGWEVVAEDRVPLVSGLSLLVSTQVPADT